MIRIQTRRAGLVCIAVNVNDIREARMTWGLTQEGASRRLCRLIDRELTR